MAQCTKPRVLPSSAGPFSASLGLETRVGRAFPARRSSSRIGEIPPHRERAALQRRVSSNRELGLQPRWKSS